MWGDSLEKASKAFSLPDVSSSDSRYATCRFRYRCEPSTLVALMTRRRIRTGKCIIRQLSLVTCVRAFVRARRWTDRPPADDKARQWHFYDDRPRVAASFDPPLWRREHVILGGRWSTNMILEFARQYENNMKSIFITSVYYINFSIRITRSSKCYYKLKHWIWFNRSSPVFL